VAARRKSVIATGPAAAVAERRKYEAVWALPEYLNHSPGEHWADLFAEIAQPEPGHTLIDLGCGNGAAGKALAERCGLRVTYLDLVDRGLKPFITQPLWKPLPARNPPWDHGYCCDVMEHIPPEFTMLVVSNILRACALAFFSISFLPDRFGKFVGAPLHLTLQSFSWWRDRLAEFGEVLDARDMLGEGVFYVRGGGR
jgi:hypothetical protein